MKLQAVLIALGAAIVLLAAPAGAATPPFTVSPTFIDFGNVALNTTATASITVTLDPGYEIAAPFRHIASFPPGSSGNAMAVESDTCSEVEGVGGTCTITFGFTPDALGGESLYTADFVVGVCLSGVDPSVCIDQPTEGTFSVDMQGVAFSAFAADPASIDFGDVPVNTESALRTVSVTLDAGYAWAGASATAPFGLGGGTCSSASVGPATCTLDIGFLSDRLGAATSSNWFVTECRVSACATSSDEIEQPLALHANSVSAFAATPASIDFGDVVVGTTATRTFTLDVDSGYELTAFAGHGSFAVQGGTCGIGSTVTCTVDVAFAPASGATASDTLQLAECPRTDVACPQNPDPARLLTTTVALRGSAVTPLADLAVAISAAPSPVQNKKPVTFTITVSNHGPDAATGATLDDVLPSASAFVAYSTSQGDCTAPPTGSTGTIVCPLGTLASGDTATIRITATPTVKNNKLIDDTAAITAASPVIDPVSADNAASVSVQVK